MALDAAESRQNLSNQVQTLHLTSNCDEENQIRDVAETTVVQFTSVEEDW